MISKILETILRLATLHPLILLAGGLAITALVAFLAVGLRSYFSAEARQIRKLTRPGIVHRFLRLEFLVAVATGVAALAYEFFVFRGRGHWIYWHGFRHRVGPPRGFFSFIRWDAERLLFRLLPAVARWWKLLGFRVASGIIIQRGYERQADHFSGVGVVALLVGAGAYFIAIQLIDRRFARSVPAAAKNPPEIMIGDVPFPWARWISHFLLLGTTRAGKSVLLRFVVWVLRQRQIPGLILDNGGDFVSKFFNPETDIILSPLDRRSPPFSFFASLRRPEHISRLAHDVVGGGGGDTSSQYFHNKTRELFTSICQALWARGSLINGQFCEAMSDEARLKSLMQGSEWETIIGDARSWGDVYSTFTSFFSIFRSLQPAAGLAKIALSADGETWECERVGVDLRQCAANMAAGRPGMIFVPYQDSDAKIMGPFLSMVFSSFCSAVMDQGEDLKRRVAMIADELGELPEIATLQAASSKGGKYGLSLFLGLQNVSQFDRIYGEHSTKIILGNCSSHVVLRLPDARSAAWAADSIGRQYKMVSSNTDSSGDHNSTSQTKREELRHRLLPNEIQHFQSLEGVLIYFGTGLVKRIRLSVRDYPEIHPRHIDLPASAWRPAGGKPVQKPAAPTPAPAAPEPDIIFRPLAEDSSGEARAKTAAHGDRKCEE